jgi:predicted RNA-binding protein with RPS1 domain
VTGISSFGAFVDLGGADGLIHISELSWSTVSSPDEIVRMGDEVDVFVLRVNAENKKIALSLKRLQPEPWETITDRYQPGDLIDATVTKLTDFGAFARVEASVEGLIHISELTHRIINHPKEVVREGDAVKVKILRIEPERRRLGLSLKQAEDEEMGALEIPPEYSIPATVDASAPIEIDLPAEPMDNEEEVPEPEAAVDVPVEAVEEPESSGESADEEVAEPEPEDDLPAEADEGPEPADDVPAESDEGSTEEEEAEQESAEDVPPEEDEEPESSEDVAEEPGPSEEDVASPTPDDEADTGAPDSDDPGTATDPAPEAETDTESDKDS